MKTSARFKNEVWRVDLAHVDELGKDNNGVKYLLVHQDQFDRFIDSTALNQEIL